MAQWDQPVLSMSAQIGPLITSESEGSDVTATSTPAEADPDPLLDEDEDEKLLEVEFKFEDEDAPVDDDVGISRKSSSVIPAHSRCVELRSLKTA